MKITPQTLDGENPYRDEITQLRLDRIGQRLTLLMVLLPIAIAVILVLGYLDLKRRVVGLQDNSAASVQTLSDDLASRFSTLSVRVAEMEQSLKKALADSQAHKADQTGRIGKLAEDLKRLETEKADANELKAVTEALGQKIDPLAERISAQDQALKASIDRVDSQTKALADSLKALEAKMTAVSDAMGPLQVKMTALAEEIKPIRESRSALEAEVKNLAATLKTDRDATQKALTQHKEASERQLGEAIQPLEARLEKLGQQIDQLQRAQTAARVLPKAAPPQVPAATVSPPSPTATPASPAVDQSSPPNLKPGQIIEKPLQ